MNFRINELYCFCAAAEDGDEGIPAFSKGAAMYPLIAADKDRLISLVPIAKKMQEAMGKKLTLLRFSVREELPWE